MYTLPKEINEIFNKFHRHEIYLIGGAVRALLLSKKTNDYDFTTSATISDISLILGIKLNDINKRYSSVKIVDGDFNIEITSFRTEGHYTDFRHPSEISFNASFANDVLRRDFTINTIAYNPKTGFRDPLNGLIDLSKNLIRTVEDANNKFYEDPIRILRGIRFATQLNFKFEEKTKEAAFNNYKILKNIKTQRQFKEIMPILLYKDENRIVEEFKEILIFSFPYIEWDWFHEECFNLLPENHLIRLAFLMPNEQNAIRVSNIYSISSEFITLSNFFIYHRKELLNKNIPIDSFLIFNKAAVTYAELLYDFIDKEHKKNIQALDILNLKIKASDLLELGYKNKDLFKLTKIMQKLILEGKVNNNRQAIMEKAKELLNDLIF